MLEWSCQLFLSNESGEGDGKKKKKEAVNY